jgi:sarcosine oxidase
MVLWRRLERDTGAELLTRTGTLELGKDIDEVATALRECGLPYELVSRNDLGRRFPTLKTGEHDALLQPDGAVASAIQVRDVLAEDSRRNGATIRSGSSVVRLEEQSDGVLLHTNAGEIHAKILVLAAGPWTASLASQLGDHLPTTATLQTSVRMGIGAHGDSQLPSIFERVDSGEEFHMAPTTAGDALVGTVRALGSATAVDGERQVDPEAADRIVRWMAQRLPEGGAEQAREGCIATWLPEDRFHLVRRGPIVTVSCCNARGFTFAPLVGARAAALAHEGLNA